MTDENAVPVYAVARSEFNPTVDKPIGNATTKYKAFRLIRAKLIERDGSDYDLSAGDIAYSPSAKGWFIDD